MLGTTHKGFEINLTQKGQTVTAKVKGLTVAQEDNAVAAITKAKHFIDEHLVGNVPAKAE